MRLLALCVYEIHYHKYSWFFVCIWYQFAMLILPQDQLRSWQVQEMYSSCLLCEFHKLKPLKYIRCNLPCFVPDGISLNTLSLRFHRSYIFPCQITLVLSSLSQTVTLFFCYPLHCVILESRLLCCHFPVKTHPCVVLEMVRLRLWLFEGGTVFLFRVLGKIKAEENGL